jgi:hypothetical protein
MIYVLTIVACKEIEKTVCFVTQKKIPKKNTKKRKREMRS